MNNRIIRYFNQNRIKVIITIFIIVFIIVLIYTVNNILANRPQTILPEDTIIDSGIPSESVISGTKVEEEKTENNISIIKEFVNYCNNGDYENAYNLLSQDCKDEVFQDVNSFIDNYVQQVFSTRKTYSLELWLNTSKEYTYRTIFQDDNILSTGIVNSGNNIEDYLTVIDENGVSKLNLNGFITKDIINKSQEINGIKITINDRKRYRSYETYSITFVNNTNNTIMINDGINSNNICLIDQNEVEYNSMINEIPVTSLELEPGMITTINIRFYKTYNLYRVISGIRFKNINSNTNDQNAELINIEIDI